MMSDPGESDNDLLQLSSERVENQVLWVFLPENQEALSELAWALEASTGDFKLMLAHCNYLSWRSHLVRHLQELCSIEIRILVLQKSEQTLYTTIRAELGEEQPAVLMVFGLEAVSNLDDLLTSTNLVRDEFRKTFHFPLVLWVNDDVLKKLLRLAPDFESWATTTTFAIAPRVPVQ